MENASKALIMAAEILIGVMVISIGVYLFYTLGNYSAETTAQIEETQLTQFNNQFLKFYGTSGGKTITCTIHDIVDLANLAQKINAANGFTEIVNTSEDLYSDSSYFIQIDLKIGGSLIRHLELKKQEDLIKLLKDYSLTEQINSEGKMEPVTKYFYIKEEPGIGELTKRVNHIKFEEYN